MSTPLETKAKLTQKCKYTRTSWFLSLNEWYNETLYSTYSNIYFASDKYTWRGKIRHEFVDWFTKSIPGINKLMRYPYKDLLFCSVLTLPVLLYSVLFWYGPYLFIKVLHFHYWITWVLLLFFNLFLWMSNGLISRVYWY